MSGAYLAVHLGARRVELAVGLLVCAVAAGTWPVRLPSELFRPDVPRDRLVLLLAALLASVVPLAVRPAQPALERTARVALAPRRALWLAVVLAVVLGGAVLAASVMAPEVSGAYVRNVVLLTGAGLLAVAVRPALGPAVPGLWVLASLVAGHRIVPDQAPDVRAWALPLLPGDQAVGAALLVLALGAAAYAVRGSGSAG